MNRNTFVRGATVGILGTTLVVGAVACSKPTGDAQRTENSNQATQQDIYNRVQPNPVFQWSQYRETLQTVERAQTDGVASTSFFLNLDGSINRWCPSLGLPVASTAQLSNPQQVLYTPHPNGGNDANVVSQQEPNGVYTGDSSGTYVVCVQPNGDKMIDYWEGDVHTVLAPAHWDNATRQIVIDGPSSLPIKTK